MDNLTGIKTPPVFFEPIKCSSYSVIRKTTLDDQGKEHESIYLAGKSPKMSLDDQNAALMSYEYISSCYVKYDDAELLSDLLTWSEKLCAGKWGRGTGKISPESIEQSILFCEKYGIPDTTNMQKIDGNPLCFNLYKFLLSVQYLRFAYDDVKEVLNTQNPNKMIISRIGLGSFSSVNIRLHPFYSTKEKNIKYIYVADSLVDVAKHQLYEAMSHGTIIKKCANPACNQYIVGGRKDRLTCSDACRKAYSRSMKHIQLSKEKD